MDAADATRAIKNARDQYERSKQQAARDLATYHRVIAEARREKALRVRDLTELTGYDREHLRRIARAAGVPPGQ